MKILAKIGRRAGTDELPRAHELVEMDLFDTDRNPWDPSGSGGGADELWEQHDYDVACPFTVPFDSGGYAAFGHQLFTKTLTVARASFAIAFVGGEFDVSEVASGGTSLVSVVLACDAAIGNWGSVEGQESPTFVSTGSYNLNLDGSGFSYAVLNPGSYNVRLWALCWSDQSVHPVVSMRSLAASIVLIPAGFHASE